MNERRVRMAAVALLLAVFVLIPRPSAVVSLPDGDRHIAAGGTLMFVRPADFGLALHPDQILVQSVIPPCDHNFDYCLYYLAPTFEGTTFKSAGVRIQARKDLVTSPQCLWTPPAGYTDFEPIVHDGLGYSTSTFAPIHDAGMGHFAEGVLYRLSVDTVCYEVETRIAQSQFSHYPPGAIEPFTSDDEALMQSRLDEVVASIRLVERPGERLFNH